jgi:uncharacterized protein (DUF4415 family)
LANRPPDKTDWARINALTDEEINKAVLKDPDAAGFDPDWSRAKVYFPKLKQLMSLRIDPDILAFFKSQGPRYQTRMNAVLRAYMEHELAKQAK